MKRSQWSRWVKNLESTSLKTAENLNASNLRFHSKMEKIQGKVPRHQEAEISLNRIKEVSNRMAKVQTISRKPSSRKVRRVPSTKSGRKITLRSKTQELWLEENTRKSKK